MSLNISCIITLKPFNVSFNNNVQVFNNECLFSGDIIIDSIPRGKAMISVCNNSQYIFGILDIDERTYSITPNSNYIQKHRNYRIPNRNLKQKRSVKDSKRKFKIHQIRRIDDKFKEESVCGNTFGDPTPPDYLRYMKSKEVPDDPNINFGKAIIEVAVYIDESMFKHKFGEDMTLISRYVTIMLAYLQKQLLQRNIEKHIKIKLIVKHFGVAPFNVVHNMTTGQYLLRFCQWKQSQAKADVSILFTNSNQWYYNKKNHVSTSIMGLAYVATLCDDHWSCLIVEGREGFKSTHILVHEFGHVLVFVNQKKDILLFNYRASHDSKEDEEFGSCDENKFIMSWSVSTGKNTWSQCSIKYFRRYLLSLQKRNKKNNKIECLTQEPNPYSPQFDVTTNEAKKPGLKIDVDQQCKAAFGSDYSAYYYEYTNVCERLECKNDFFTVSTEGALDGTKCGDNKYCERDICKRKT